MIEYYMTCNNMDFSLSEKSFKLLVDNLSHKYVISKFDINSSCVQYFADDVLFGYSIVKEI